MWADLCTDILDKLGGNGVEKKGKEKEKQQTMHGLSVSVSK